MMHMLGTLLAALRGGRNCKAADGNGRAAAPRATEGEARAKAWLERRPLLLPAVSPAMLELPCMVDIEEVGLDDVPRGSACDCYIRNRALAESLGYARSCRRTKLRSGDVAYVVTTDMMIPKDADRLPDGCKVRAFRARII